MRSRPLLTTLITLSLGAAGGLACSDRMTALADTTASAAGRAVDIAFGPQSSGMVATTV